MNFKLCNACIATLFTKDCPFQVSIVLVEHRHVEECCDTTLSSILDAPFPAPPAQCPSSVVASERSA
ncbi:hypothetical protein BDQ17DRAFT_1359746 [Cyathus striatus]|nr:hypothetical protein BDQ17DRAFT_1359746 [Cyathus striatus]